MYIRNRSMQAALLVFLLATRTVAFAQTSGAQVSPTQRSATQAAPVQGPTLDERYTKCIQNAQCSVQDRLQIVQEENSDMNDHFHKIYETCVAINFKGCVDSDTQQREMALWYNADYRMEQMMLSVEAQALAMKETAAGGTESPSPSDKKGQTLWDKIWGNNP